MKKRALRDPTPEDYRGKGLRTAGHWSGSAQSLSYISLENGWVVSTNQTGGEQMDVAIASAIKPPQVAIRYVGKIETRSSVSLVEPERPASR